MQLVVKQVNMRRDICPDLSLYKVLIEIRCAFKCMCKYIFRFRSLDIQRRSDVFLNVRVASPVPVK
jgi:hypothetical protein